MDWNDLRYLLAVHRQGSLARGAAALGVTKATASRRLAALEEALGARVFDRTREGLALTEEGRKVLVTAEEMERAAGDLASRVGAASEGSVRGTVRLTAPPWLAERLFIPELGALKDRHPKLEVQLLGSNALVDMTKREADLALRNVRPTQSSLVARKAGKLAGRIYASRLYLERRGSPASREEVLAHDLLAYGGLGGMPGFEWLASPPFAGRIVFRANDPMGLCSAAAAGLGLAGIPCILGDEEPDLVRVEALGAGVTEMFLVMPEQLRESPPVRAVATFVTDVMRARASYLLGEGRGEVPA